MEFYIDADNFMQKVKNSGYTDGKWLTTIQLMEVNVLKKRALRWPCLCFLVKKCTFLPILIICYCDLWPSTRIQTLVSFKNIDI